MHDIIHIKRSITTRLYNLSKTAHSQDSSTLSAKVINYLVQFFPIVVAQNKTDPEAMKSSLRCIVPHSLGDYSGCSNSWCRYQQNPNEYKHTNLPHGRNLHGDALKSALTDIFSQYHSEYVVDSTDLSQQSTPNGMNPLTVLLVRKHPRSGIMVEARAMTFEWLAW